MRLAARERRMNNTGRGRFLPDSGKKKAPKFYKIILPSVLHHQRLIPEEFVRQFGHELSNVALLTVPSGHTWNVELTKIGSKLWLCEGWTKFSEYYSITLGYFLLFEYRGKSAFTVYVFDLTGCEVQYTCNKDSPQERYQAKESPLLDKEEMGGESDGSSVECLGNTSTGGEKHYPVNMCNARKFPESIMIEEMSDDDSIELLGCSRSHLIPSLRRQGAFECKHSQSPQNTGDLKMRDKEIPKGKQPIDAARMLQTKNPSFTISMRQHNMSYMYVMQSFAENYLARDLKYVTLRSIDGREWKVRCMHRGGVHLAKGWSIFRQENNLRVGDVCVFELVNMKDAVLKASIFKS